MVDPSFSSALATVETLLHNIAPSTLTGAENGRKILSFDRANIISSKRAWEAHGSFAVTNHTDVWQDADSEKRFQVVMCRVVYTTDFTKPGEPAKQALALADGKGSSSIMLWMDFF